MWKHTLVASFFVHCVVSQSHFLRRTPIKAHVEASKSRIIGGDESEPNAFPFQAGLDINGVSFCAGALLSSNYVVTAAHCGVVIRSVNVILGAHNLSNTDERGRIIIPGNLVIVHQDFDRDTLQNDIALIRLNESVEFNEYIQPAKLPPLTDFDNDYLDEVVTAIGWGLPRDVPWPSLLYMSDVLLEVTVLVSDLEECADYYNEEDEIYVRSTNICTSGYRNRGTCDGDSGGPLVWNDVVIGVTSFGTDQCEWCSPSVYTKIASYLDWIEANSDVVLNSVSKI